EQRPTMLGQQPIDTALRQLITYQQQHIIKSALPILTPQSHTPILAAHACQTRPATPKPGSLKSGLLAAEQTRGDRLAAFAIYGHHPIAVGHGATLRKDARHRRGCPIWHVAPPCVIGVPPAVRRGARRVIAGAVRDPELLSPGGQIPRSQRFPQPGERLRLRRLVTGAGSAVVVAELVVR